MSIERLINVLTPPSSPLEIPSEDEWRKFQLESTKLPGDYIEFIRKFGTGCIDDFIWIFNPSSKNEDLNLQNQIVKQLDALRGLGFGGEPIPFSLFPDRGGLLPFGVTDNGDVLFWKTKGDPSAWSIVIGESRSSNYEEYNLGISDFLAAILAAEIASAIFPTDFPSNYPKFIPIT